MSEKLIILNNKCNFTKEDFIDYIKKIEVLNNKNKIVLCPTICYLPICNVTNIILGSQNVSNYNEGAYTGEVSARQLKSLNVSYTLVGHYERKKYFKETNSDVKSKIKNLLENDITPIVCIGDTKDEYNKGITKDILIKNLKEILFDIRGKDKVVIAYEPIWSIEENKTPSLSEIEDTITCIKNNFPGNLVLYGGSINAKNIEYLNKISLIDGYLLGRLSLDPNKFKKFLQVLGK